LLEQPETQVTVVMLGVVKSTKRLVRLIGTSFESEFVAGIPPVICHPAGRNLSSIPGLGDAVMVRFVIGELVGTEQIIYVSGFVAINTPMSGVSESTATKA
jgi:hypothetical protein